jgi:hypothetical protein
MEGYVREKVRNKEEAKKEFNMINIYLSIYSFTPTWDIGHP